MAGVDRQQRAEDRTPALQHTGWLFAFTFILFAAFALRLWNLGTQSLWHDEGWSVFAAYTMLNGPMGIRGMDVNAPPLFYMSIGLWLRLTGDSVWAMRCWSLIVGVVVVALAGLIARRWFGVGAGALTMVCLAFSPILWVFSQEIRAYIPMPLTALLLLALADAFLRPKGVPVQRRVWLWLPLVELCALYMHNLSVPLVAWLNMTIGAALLLHRNFGRLARWIAMQSAVLVLYLPWLLTQRPTGTPLNTPPTLTPSLLWDIWQSYFTGIKPLLGADALLSALIALFGAAALIGSGAALLRLRSSQRMWLTLSQAVLLPVFQLIIVLAAHIDFHPRYFILGVPATMMLIAAGLSTLTIPSSIRPSRLSVPIRALISALRPVLLTSVGALAAALMIRMAGVTYSSPIYQHDDFRTMAQRYAQLDEDDAIIIPYGWEPALDYYSRHMNFRAKFIEIPLHSSPEAIAARLRDGLTGVERAETLTWYQLPADVRGAYPCLLGAVGVSLDALTVSGIRTDAYQIAPGALPALAAPMQDTAMQIGGSRLVQQGLISAEGGEHLCLITRWQLDGDQDWRAAVRVYDAAGRSIMRADADLLDDRQLPPSLWQQPQVPVAFARLGWLRADGERFPIRAHLYTLNGMQTPGKIIGELVDTPAKLRAVDWATTPRQYQAPAIPPEARTAARFQGVGSLIGVETSRLVAVDSEPFVRLYWQAAATPPADYTVFVHLAAPDGRIIAQSDAQPLNGVRPTTSWRAGEYIVDGHVLTFNTRDYAGPARLVVGLYDAVSGQRVPLTDGKDALSLPLELEVR